MTGNFSVIHEGNTLIKDHAKAVNALNDIATATTTQQAKDIAAAALVAIGEIVDVEATGVHAKLETQAPGPLTTRGNGD